MTTAVLSFATAGRVAFRCDAVGIEESRPLEASPPFAAWAGEYAAAQHHPTAELRRLELARPRDAEPGWREAPEEVRLVELGREIGRWLDGEQRWLARMLKAASGRRALVPEPLILEIEASAEPGAIEQAALDAPWELIATDGHLALDPGVRLSPVRRLDVPGIVRPPSECRLSVLFMAAQPRDVTVLDFEREEAAIAARIGEVDPDMLDLFVEESGMLEGLVTAAGHAAESTIVGSGGHAGPVDVIHISCHGLGGARPILLLEDEVGDRAEVTADDLVSRLGTQVPALVFVSACSTAEASAVGRSFAAELCIRGWPAVLGWSGPVNDGEATQLAAQLYRGLAQRMSLPEALVACRLEHVEPGRPPRKVWHQARLFLGRAGGGRIDGGSAVRRPARTGQRQYLDRLGRLPVARDDEFVGRRRALQRVLASLRSDELVGAVIHGAGQLGKSSLAARVSSRRHDLQTIVIYKDYSAGAILTAISAHVREGTDEIIAHHYPDGPWDAPAFGRALHELLEGPCRAANAGAILLVVDDFERALDPPCVTETHAKVRPELAATIGALIAAFAGARTRSRLLFTSRYRFTALDVQGLDSMRHLWHEPLGAMPRDDLAKRARAAMEGRGARDGGRYAAAVELCRGNPGLLQILLTIIGCSPETWPAVHDELRAYGEQGAPVTGGELVAFMARVALDRLIAQLDRDERDLMRLLTAFETHVPASVAAGLGRLIGILDHRGAVAIGRMISLGLLDVALPASCGPSASAAGRSEPHEVAVTPLAAPPLLAATGPMPDDALARVAEASRGSLRAAWDLAVRSRAFRECHELTRLARIAADTSILAEVAGPVAVAFARTDPRGVAALAIAVEASEALWPNADELGAMAHACEIVGHPEITGRLLSRGLALEDLAPAQRARLHFLLAERHEHRGELAESERLFATAEALFEQLGAAREVAETKKARAHLLHVRGELDGALRILKEEALPIYERLGNVREETIARGKIADILYRRGELDEALRIRTEEELPVYERLGDVRSKAMTQDKIADILYVRWELDEALRIWREEVLPVYERLGEVRAAAGTRGQIASVFWRRGELDEALRIWKEEELPVYERLGDVRLKALTQGRIADALNARGELDEALRIRTEEELPVYERLGDVREKAVAQGKIAEILYARGALDEALRIRTEVAGVFEQIGDVRSWAVTRGQIADILQVRGEWDEALRIRTQEELPVYERLGDAWWKAATQGQIAGMLCRRGELDEALPILKEASSLFERLGRVREQAAAQGQIAQILCARGELDEALRIFKEDVLPVCEQLGDEGSKARAQEWIAGILRARGELAEARGP